MINFTVGPVQSSDAVCAIGAEQVPYFRTAEFSELMFENERLVKQFTHTTDDSRVVFMTCLWTSACLLLTKLQGKSITRMPPLLSGTGIYGIIRMINNPNFKSFGSFEAANLSSSDKIKMKEACKSFEGFDYHSYKEEFSKIFR